MLKEKLLTVFGKIKSQNFKNSNFKKTAKFFFVFLILLAAGLAFPRDIARADILGIGAMIGGIFNGIIYAVFYILFYVAYVIAVIGAWILNISMNPAIMNNVFANTAIYDGWKIIRDICNLLFLLIMLLVAFGTIVQSNKYNIKNSLPKLIIAIFLINFSFVIAGAIIDFGNILMYGILKWMCPATSTICFQSMYDSLMQVIYGFRVKYIFNASFGLFTWEQVIEIAIATVYTFMYGFILLAMAGFITVRTVGLVILLILAPFAYFGEVMPGMEKIASKWWNNIWSYTLFGPIFALMLYITGQLAAKTVAVPPIVDPDLAFLGPTITIIISNIIPLLFLLAVIPVTRELGLAGSDTIVKNTTGLGEKIGKGAVGVASDSWGRYVARGANMEVKKGDGLLKKTYIRARRAASYTSPKAWKDAYNAKKASDAHDYDAARGRIQDTMGWKSKYVESEKDRVVEAETHKAVGEMGIKDKDGMVYALKTAVREGNGPMVAEIMRLLAVNGDTDSAVEALNKQVFGVEGHTAEDYNKIMNQVIKPLLKDEKTAKLSNEIGKSEEKNNNFIYGGHNSYDSATNKYSMKDMSNGSEADKAKAKKDQQDFMIGRWDSKDEFSRIGTIAKTNFEGKKIKAKDKDGKDIEIDAASEEGAMFLGRLKGTEALKQVKRFKPKVAAFIAEKYQGAFDQWKKDGKKEGTIFANMNDEDIKTAAEIHDKIIAIRSGKDKDNSDENEEGYEESSGKKKKKGSSNTADQGDGSF